MTFLLGLAALLAACVFLVLVSVAIHWLFNDDIGKMVLSIIACVVVGIAMYQALTSLGQSIQDSMESPGDIMRTSPRIDDPVQRHDRLPTFHPRIVRGM